MEEDGGVGEAGSEQLKRRKTMKAERCCRLQPLVMMVVVALCLLVREGDAGVSDSSVVWSATRTPTSGITCWTCNNKANNEECNDWAPDLKCLVNQTVCQTVHRLRAGGSGSVAVNKRCVHSSDCGPRHVGCSPDSVTEQLVCVSCCDYNYCNQEVPVNSSTAQQLSSFSTAPASTSHSLRPSLPVLLALLWLGSTRILPSLIDVTSGSWALSRQ